MAQKKKEPTGQLMISIEQFTRTRESVIVALSNVQKGLQHVNNGLTDLLNAYISHTSSVIAGEDGSVETLQLPASIEEIVKASNAAAAGAFAAAHIGQAVTASAPAAASAAAAAASAATATPAADAGKGTKRKREKKEKDPNAPKRPLTAAFLYTKHARPLVKSDLEAELAEGDKLEPNAINIEVTKRWNELSEEDKETWKASYRNSMRVWKEEMAAYLASKGAVAPVVEGDHDASDAAEAAAALETSDDEDEDATSPVVRAATPPTAGGKAPRKRQKTASQVNGATAGPTQVPLPASSRAQAAEPAAKKSRAKAAKPAAAEEPKKKAKGARSSVRNAAEVEAEAEAPEKETKPKKSRSKRKSEAGA